MHIVLLSFCVLWIIVLSTFEARARAHNVIASGLKSSAKVAQGVGEANKAFASQKSYQSGRHKQQLDTEPEDDTSGKKKQIQDTNKNEEPETQESNDEVEELDDQNVTPSITGGKGVVMNIYSGGPPPPGPEEAEEGKQASSLDESGKLAKVLSHMERDEHTDMRHLEDEKAIETDREEGGAEVQTRDILNELHTEQKDAEHEDQETKNKIEAENEKIEMEEEAAKAEEHAEMVKADEKAEALRDKIHTVEKDMKQTEELIEDDERNIKEEKTEEAIKLKEIQEDERTKLDEIKQVGESAEVQQKTPSAQQTVGGALTATETQPMTAEAAMPPAASVGRCLDPCSSHVAASTAPAGVPSEVPALKSSQISIPAPEKVAVKPAETHQETFEHCQPLSFLEAKKKKHQHRVRRISHHMGLTSGKSEKRRTMSEEKTEKGLKRKHLARVRAYHHGYPVSTQTLYQLKSSNNPD